MSLQLLRCVLLLSLSAGVANAGNLFRSGFESNQIQQTTGNSVEGWLWNLGSAPTFATAIKNGGAYSLRVNPASSLINAVRTFTAAASGRTYYVKFSFYVTTLPSVDVLISDVQNSTATNYAEIRLTTGGALQLWDGTTQVGSNSSTLSTATWYTIEFSYVYTSGALVARLNGTQFASGTGTASGAVDRVEVLNYPSCNADYYFDDVIVNDDQGSAENSWPAAQKILWLFPVSDLRKGNWTNGGGGTTNIFEGVNNTPPTGNTTDADGKSIKDVNASTTDTIYFNFTDYTTAGIGTYDVIKTVQFLARSGEHSATATKTGKIYMYSNPATSGTTHNFGADAGAHGTEISNWRTTYDAIQYAPSVTNGTQPVACGIKTSNQTTGVEYDLMAIQVSYLVGSAPAGGDVRRERRIF